MFETPLGRFCWYELLTTDPEAAPGFYYIRVADVNAAAETVKELGGQVLSGPMEVPGGDMIAHCLDPQGAWFAVHASAQA